MNNNNDVKVDYEAKIQERQEYNNRQVLKNINTKGMQVKIENYAKIHKLNSRYVEQKIIDDSLFSLQFAISPGRQSYHERIASDYISSLDCIDEFHNLPASGPESKFVGTKGINKGKQERSLASKSIDFEIKVGLNVVYVSHKYTKDDGGAQDNQYNDIRTFISDSLQLTQNGCVSDNIKFVALVDGAYYQRAGRMSSLIEEGMGLIEVMTIEEIYDYLLKIKKSEFMDKIVIDGKTFLVDITTGEILED